MECVSPLDEADDAVGRVCEQQETAGFAGEGHNSEKKEKYKGAVAAG